MSVRWLLNRLGDVVELVNCQKRLASIDGFLTDLEGYALFLLAAHGPGLGQIVEIGSYQGRSTVFLAAGAHSTSREKVVAIDHFGGSPQQQAGQSHQSEVLLRDGSCFPQFQANLKRVGLLEQIEPIVASSAEAVRGWQRPIRLLFIDGDHSYESSREDFELWSPFVISQGVICFHDIDQWPGVTRFYQELMQSNRDYQELATVGSLKLIQRR